MKKMKRIYARVKRVIIRNVRSGEVKNLYANAVHDTSIMLITYCDLNDDVNGDWVVIDEVTVDGYITEFEAYRYRIEDERVLDEFEKTGNYIISASVDLLKFSYTILNIDRTEVFIQIEDLQSRVEEIVEKYGDDLKSINIHQTIERCFVTAEDFYKYCEVMEGGGMNAQ